MPNSPQAQGVTEAWSEGYGVGYREALSDLLADASRLTWKPYDVLGLLDFIVRFRDAAYSVPPERSAGAQGEGGRDDPKLLRDAVIACLPKEAASLIDDPFAPSLRAMLLHYVAELEAAALSVPPERERIGEPWAIYSPSVHHIQRTYAEREEADKYCASLNRASTVPDWVVVNLYVCRDETPAALLAPERERTDFDTTRPATPTEEAP